jgi:hypothetical protein
MYARIPVVGDGIVARFANVYPPVWVVPLAVRLEQVNAASKVFAALRILMADPLL